MPRQPFFPAACRVFFKSNDTTHAAQVCEAFYTSKDGRVPVWGGKMDDCSSQKQGGYGEIVYHLQYEEGNACKFAFVLESKMGFA